MSEITLTVTEQENIHLIVESGGGEQQPTQEKSVTPSYEAQTVLPDEGFLLSAVNVAAIPEPTERISIKENGEYNVARVGVADVNVPQGIFPSGTKSITENGTYDVSQYASANVSVPTDPEKGIVFEDFDAQGLPHTARIVGYTTDLPDGYLKNTFNANAQGTLVKNVQKIIFDESISFLSGQCLNVGTSITDVIVRGDINNAAQNSIANLANCLSITFLGNVVKITVAFGGNTKVMLYDFSHCTAVPDVYSGSVSLTFGHASGCVFRVPSALLAEWQNAPMWRDLTDIVWEGV